MACPQELQPADVRLLSRVSEDRARRPARTKRIAKRVVPLGQPDTPALIGQLPRGTQAVAKEIIRPRAVILIQVSQPVGVRVLSVCQDVGQIAIDVEHIPGSLPV